MSTPRPPTPRTRPQKAKGLHPRNLHNGPYDFTALSKAHPELARFVASNQHGNLGIDFADPQAVKHLNAALLRHHYQVQQWDIPDGALCPPVPGRADYIHYVAELLASSAGATRSRARDISLLDIGTGASGIYPLLASQIYGWHCVASDINPQSIENVATIIAANPALKALISVRQQTDKNQFFAGIIQPGEYFDVGVCNPPFHASAEAALKGSVRKLGNLARNRGEQTSTTATLNFGGHGAELWCKGGERLFLKKLIKESQTFASQCRWFTSLVSNGENVKPLIKLLRQHRALDIKEIPMTQGHKITRILAWTFTER